MADAFICYARTDKELALKPQEGLGERQREVRIGFKNIPPTTECKAFNGDRQVSADSADLWVSSDSNAGSL
jgi:hypothetical protein